jgi:Tetratricopeptide repeat/TIR domain
MGSTNRRASSTGDHPTLERVIVSYVGPDQMWAEWIATELQRANCAVDMTEWNSAIHADLLIALEQAQERHSKFVAVVSGTYLSLVLPGGLDSAAEVTSYAETFAPVIVGRGQLPRQFWQIPLVSLLPATSTSEARTKLLRTVLGPRRAAEVPAEDFRAMSRFPGHPPAVWSPQIPMRNPYFTGRSELLRELRRQLSADWTAVLPHGLEGLPGVGKTQLAIEYAHRFAADYDLVWWVPAEGAAIARHALAELARRLDLAGPGAEHEELVRAALEALRTGQPYRRWLLIFDNAESPEVIQQLLVDGPGATLITSRLPQWSEHADVLQVSEYIRSESISYLRRRVPQLSDADLNQVAEDLGDLPLGLEHAAAWLSATRESAESYLSLYHERTAELLSTIQLARYPVAIAVSWEISANRLRENSPVAADLLEICAFLGPALIPFSLFTAAPDGVLPPALEAEIREPTARVGLLRAVGASSLAVVEEAPSHEPGLRQHRMVQALTKDTVSREQRSRYVLAAHRLLAAADPGDPANPAHWARYRELLPLVLSSDAVTDTAPEVRRLVSNQIQALINTGERETALQLADQAEAEWAPHVEPVDRDMIALAMQRAGILRSLGRIKTAIDISRATYDLCMDQLGPENRLTMGMASSLAAGHRRLGELAIARELDQRTWGIRARIYEPDHVQTLLAGHNVALNLRLAGRFDEALEIDRHNFAAFARTLGPNHQHTLFARNNVARDLRECGRYYDSLTLQEDVYAQYLAHIGIDNPGTLRAMKNLALSRRKAGRYQEAWELADQVLLRHRQKFGELNVESLSAATNFANDHRCIEQYAGGLGYAEQAVRGFRQVLGEEHGFVGCAMTNHAVLIRLTGNPQKALEVNQEALGILTGAFGADHRYSLTCAVNLGSDLAAIGEFAAARERDEDSYDRLRRTSGEDHPYTLSCALNLALDLRSLNERGKFRELLSDLLERYRRTLGDAHPETIAATARQRADCDIEPPPT